MYLGWAAVKMETDRHPDSRCAATTIIMVNRYVPKYDQPCTVEQLEQIDSGTLTTGEFE
jgi:hypothetical protein